MAGRSVYQIGVHMTPEGYAEIKERSGKAGLTMPEYLRRAALGAEIREAPHPDLPVLILEMRRAADGMDRLLRYAAEAGLPPEDEVSETLEKARAAEEKIAEAYGY